MRAAARALLPALRTPLAAARRPAHTTSVMSPIDPKDLPPVAAKGIGKRLSIKKGEPGVGHGQLTDQATSPRSRCVDPSAGDVDAGADGAD